MIAQLTGTVIAVHGDYIVVDVHNVGFAVHVPANTAPTIGTQVVLHTHLHVRENELTLYGFTDPQQKELFELLLSVSGVGPKVALNLIATLSPETLQAAILNGQPDVLARAPGVGRKTGEAIVLHLKDKLKRRGVTAAPFEEEDADVIAALTALGFSLVEAQRALQQIVRDDAPSLDEKIRRALAVLGS